MQLQLPPFVSDLMKEGAKYLIGAAAPWVGKVGYDWWRTRPARAFWRPFISNDLRLVLGGFEDKNFEPTGLIGIGDAIALAELQHYLARIGGGDPPVLYSDRLDGDALKHTIIALGGPDANRVTREMIGQIDSKLRFGDPEMHDVVIRDTACQPPHFYDPHLSTNDRAGTDYGLILRAPNPCCPEKDVMIIAGSYGHGTWAATRYVMSPAFLALPEAKARGALECLVKTDVMRDTPQAIRLIVVRTIPSKVAAATA
jgi:hypothetical protein